MENKKQNALSSAYLKIEAVKISLQLRRGAVLTKAPHRKDLLDDLNEMIELLESAQYIIEKNDTTN